MNIFHFRRLERPLGLSGYRLGFEQFYLTLHSLQTLHVQNHFKNTYFWGRIFGSKMDYLIAFGYEHDVFNKPKYFYSMDGVFWNLMPSVTENNKVLAQNCTSRMKGDPAYTVAVGDFGAEMDDCDGDECEDDAGTLKEEDRLSATVEMITEEAAAVPRGALFSVDEERVVENPAFAGLCDKDAAELYNFYHYRPPREKWCTRFFKNPEIDFDVDFLDSIDQDIPEGSWSLKKEIVDLQPVAVVRSLQWPGMTAFHCLYTPFYGFIYKGDGRKNMDMPFMIDNKIPEDSGALLTQFMTETENVK